MRKIILTPEVLEKLQEIIESNLEAMELAKYNNSKVRKTIGKIIVSQFKKYLKIY